MPCYSPLQAFFKFDRLNPSGYVTFSGDKRYDREIKLSCRNCIGCRLENSRNWAVRCMHEASLYENNCFITLTYNHDYLPKDGSLNKKHFQDFMKRLRKKFTGHKIRFYHCGEYGSKLQRPHYHALLFNFDFPDKTLWDERDGTKLYRSEILESLWPFGFCTVGAATFKSAAYIARYCMKKINGSKKEDHYSRVNLDTGERYQIQPEYTTMSLKPGIGADWFEKYKSDVFPSDFVVVNGKKCSPPAYYYKLLQRTDPELFEIVEQNSDIKSMECSNNDKFVYNSLPERLAVRKICAEARASKLVRELEI